MRKIHAGLRSAGRATALGRNPARIHYPERGARCTASVAERSVTEFFESSGKLATEHPQIRGDGAGSFTLARVQAVELSDDNPRISSLLARRLELDAEIESLQLRRNEFPNSEYIQRLQALILQSAQVSEEIEMLRESSQADVE